MNRQQTMSSTDFCPECGRAAPSHVETRTETYQHKEHSVTLENVIVRVCDDCGHDRCDPDLDDATLRRLYAATGRRVRDE